MELKANELRIGNYINCPNEKQNPFRIDWFEYLTKDKCKIVMETMPNTHGLTWELKDIKPIPLTEEWLLKFGFRFKSNSERYVIGQLTEESNYQYEFDLFKNNGKFFTKNNTEIKYVHLLQNAYFFKLLSGKELTIK